MTRKFLGDKELHERLAEVEMLGGAARAMSTEETAEELKQVSQSYIMQSRVIARPTVTPCYWVSA